MTRYWLIAGLGVLLAVLGWAMPPRSQSRVRAVPQHVQAEGLRVAIESARAESAALRRELDRVLAEISAGRERSSAALVAGAGDERLSETGPAAFPRFVDRYLATADPRARQVLLPAIIRAGGVDAAEFLASQIQAETDPELKRALLAEAARVLTPGTAKTLQGAFLASLASVRDPTDRIAALRGLRLARSAEASAGLLQAAADPSPEVRMAAFDVLAARRLEWAQIQDLASKDPSPAVRRFAECRLLVAKALKE